MKYFLPLLVILFCACQEGDPADPDLNLVDEISVERLNLALNDFQWDLFKRVLAAEETAENLNLSPLSVASALYLTYEGADSDTRQAMSEALEFADDDKGAVHLGAAYRDLMDLLEDGDHLSNVNGVFWDKNRMFPRDSFLMYAGKYFDAEQFDLDFQTPAALATINGWVNDATESRIEKIIEKINAEEVMFLISALYFQADWDAPFEIESTSQRPFTTRGGEAVQVPFMFQDVNTIPFYEGSDFVAVNMHFADDKYSMTLLLPGDHLPVDEFVANLTLDRLEKLFDSDLKPSRMHLLVPKFEVESKFLLNNVLKSMGMEIAFDPHAADFSNLGVAPEGNLYIARVNHKTYLKVDEKGAEGAAVTSVGIGVESAPPVLNFNRPFVFLLRHIETGALVFAGKIENPL